MQSQKSPFSENQSVSFSHEFWSPPIRCNKKNWRFPSAISSIFSHILRPVPPPPCTSFKDDHITINGYFVYRQTLSAEQKSNVFFCYEILQYHQSSPLPCFYFNKYNFLELALPMTSRSKIYLVE